MEKPRSRLAEFLMLVLGVFIALAAERWVADRSERALASEYAASLLSDLVEDSASHAEWTRLGQYRAASLRRLLDDMNGVGPRVSGAAALVDLWFGAIVPLPQFQTATYRDLISTGNIRLLDPDLRRGVVAFHSRLEENQRVYGLWGFERPRFGHLVPGDVHQVMLTECPADPGCASELAADLWLKLPAGEQTAIDSWRERPGIRDELQAALMATRTFQIHFEDTGVVLQSTLEAARR